MRIIALMFFVFVSLYDVALAQQSNEGRPTRAIHVEEVLNANPLPDGKAYRIDLLLQKGRRASYEIAPSEAAKIADGLSKPATAEGQKEQVATLVYGMNVQVDSKGLAVILTPRGRSGPLEPLAIPVTGVDQLLALLQTKIAEAKANAAKQPHQP